MTSLSRPFPITGPYLAETNQFGGCAQCGDDFTDGEFALMGSRKDIIHPACATRYWNHECELMAAELMRAAFEAYLAVPAGTARYEFKRAIELLALLDLLREGKAP